MEYKGIIITGTSGVGKSTIVQKLATQYEHFQQVKALTTRQPRRDDNAQYIYIDEANFQVFHDKNVLVTETCYRNEHYGISGLEVEQVVGRGYIPILVMSPESLKTFECLNQYLSFFIDASDEELDKRLQQRDQSILSDSVYERRKLDRQEADIPNYIIHNHKVADVVELINELWNYAGVGGTLPEKLIKHMISCDMLITDADMQKVQGASYDLTLGDEYYYAGEIRRLEKNNLFLKIEPYDYAIVSCKEQICLPKDVSANFGLTVGLFCQGIILSNGQQVDPGFRGTLFCLLFNTSNRVVAIKRGSHYATIEFSKMLGFASKYKGKYQGKKDIINYIPTNVMYGAINELKKEIEELKTESRNMQTLYMGVIAIIVAALSVLMVFR